MININGAEKVKGSGYEKITDKDPGSPGIRDPNGSRYKTLVANMEQIRNFLLRVGTIVDFHEIPTKKYKLDLCVINCLK
jgi:hypothetical protein